MQRFLLLLLAVFSCFAAEPEKLVVISIDGLDARLLRDADRLKLKIPNIAKLAKQGAVSTAVTAGPVDYTSVIVGAAKAGRKTALINASGAATFAFPTPAAQDGAKAVEFEPISAASTPAKLADRVAKMFPSFDKQLWDDSSSAQAALYLLDAEKPDVLFVHFAELDAEQHETSAMSVYARAVLEIEDDWVGQIVAKAAPGSLIAVVSGNGFQNENHIVRPNVLLLQAKLPAGAKVAHGLIGTGDKAVAAYLRTLIGNKKYGIAREVPLAEVATRSPDLKNWIAGFDTLPDVVASQETRGAAYGAGSHKGVHPFWPTHTDFRSVFVIAGPGISHRTLGPVDLVDVAPTLSEAIGLPPGKRRSVLRPATK